MWLIYELYIQKVNNEIMALLDFNIREASNEILGNLLIYHIEDWHKSKGYDCKFRVDEIANLLVSRLEEDSDIQSYSLFNGYSFIISTLTFYFRYFENKNLESRLHTHLSKNSNLFQFENLNNDLSSGRAALIVAFIDLYKVTNNIYYLFLGDKVLEQLLSDIKFYKKGLFWLTHHNFIKPIIGLNKGNIGINFSLIKHFSISKNRQLKVIIDKSNNYILSQFKVNKEKVPNFEVDLDPISIKEKKYEQLIKKTELPILNDMSLQSGMPGMLLNSIFGYLLYSDAKSLKEVQKQSLLLVKSIPAAINGIKSMSILSGLSGFILPLTLARDICGIKNSQPINLLLQKGIEMIDNRLLHSEINKLELLNSLLQFLQILNLTVNKSECYLKKLYSLDIENPNKESKLTNINSENHSILYTLFRSTFPRIDEYLGGKKFKEIVYNYTKQKYDLDYRKFLQYLEGQEINSDQKNLRHIIRHYHTSFRVVNNCENFFHQNLLSKYRYHLYKSFLAGKETHYSKIKLTLNAQMFSVVTNVPLSNIGYVRASDGNLDAYLDKLKNRGNKIFLCYFAVSLFSKEILTDLRDYTNQEQFILLNYYNGQYRTVNDAIAFIRNNFPEIFKSVSDVETIIEEFILLSLRVGILEYDEFPINAPTSVRPINSNSNLISM